MRKNATKEIGGITYECTQLHPKVAMRVLTKLVQKFGGPLGAALESFGKAGSNGPMAASAAETILDAEVDFAKIFGSLGEKLGEDDLWNLCEDLCQCVIAVVPQGGNTVGGQLKGENFEAHFSQPKMLVNLMAVAIFSLEVNFKDFLDGIKEKVQSVLGSGLESTSDA